MTNLYNSNQPTLLLDLSNNKGVEYPSNIYICIYIYRLL